jgi:prophage regulatory protein
MSPDIGEAAPLRLLRLPDVIARVGIKRTAIFDAIKAGTFPAQIRLGKRCSCWSSAEIEIWVRARIAEARGAA